MDWLKSLLCRHQYKTIGVFRYIDGSFGTDTPCTAYSLQCRRCGRVRGKTVVGHFERYEQGVLGAEEETKSLDEQLEQAGMLTVTQMLSGNPLLRHVGVDDLDGFDEWLNMRHSEMVRMKARMILSGKEDDELYEWVLCHAAVYSEVVVNFNAARQVD